MRRQRAQDRCDLHERLFRAVGNPGGDHHGRGVNVNERKLSTCASSRATILRPAGTETITTEHRPARCWFEGHAVRLAALIAGNLKLFAFRSSSTALSRSAKIRPARIATGFAAFGMGQPTLAIVILFSLTKSEGVSTFGASNFKIWHRYLPGNPS